MEFENDIIVDGDLTAKNLTLGATGTKIKYNTVSIVTLPAQGTRRLILNIATSSVIRVHLSGSENGFYQPIIIEIARPITGTTKPSIIRNSTLIHPHSNDISFSSDDNGDVWMEKVQYSTGRTIRISKVEELLGTCTLSTTSVTSVGVGIDESIIHSHTFNSIINKPTTISGYGITDTFAPVNAEQNVQSDWNATTGDEFIKNKPSLSNNITIRRVLIPVSALPANFTSTDVKNWLNANQNIGDNEVLFWETTGDTVVVTLAVNILTPTEGQSITGDLNTSFEILGATSINITSPVEGQNITGDLTTSFEIII